MIHPTPNRVSSLIPLATYDAEGNRRTVYLTREEYSQALAYQNKEHRPRLPDDELWEGQEADIERKRRTT